MRIAYLGPTGTFTEDALREATSGDDTWAGQTTLTVHDAIVAVQRKEAERAFVPIENSIEGSVRSTLDALAFDAPDVGIIGEYDFAVRPNLIARRGTSFEAIDVVLSHPQPLAQCARFLRTELPRAERRPVSSTAEAVRIVSEEGQRPWSAIGARSAADLYGCAVLREDIVDEASNITRFVWIAPFGTEAEGEGEWKTTLVFSELGEDHPGALVEALQEFSSRAVNLSRIESRPLRLGLGRYMFFIDIEGSARDPKVSDAIEALRAKAESVRILGSYPVE